MTPTRRRGKPYHYPASATESAPTRRAHCPHCKALLRIGAWDAQPLLCDSERLTQQGELLALLLGLTTWLVIEPHVYRRHAMAIRDEPFPKIGYILRSHRCGTPPPPTQDTRIPSWLRADPEF